jgi:hypothetical protein
MRSPGPVPGPEQVERDADVRLQEALGIEQRLAAGLDPAEDDGMDGYTSVR